MPEPIEILSFEDALALEPEQKKRHLLLGNGFSRAWKDDVFAYGAIYDQADFQRLSEHGKRIFAVLETYNFETVMRSLKAAAHILSEYSPSEQATISLLRADAEVLKEILVQTLGRRHPSRPSEVSPSEYAHVRAFLSKFNDVYTLNYDLLLYWAVMQTEIEPPLALGDGFRTPEDGPAPYVTWEMENSYDQRMFYLHGALHVFDAGHEIHKFTWVNTQAALMDQIRSALDQELYPIYVSDGDSSAKRAQVRHSDYLVRGHKSLQGIGNTIYVFGHSMDPGDDHVLRLIEKGRCSRLCVGLYGEPDDAGNQAIRRRCRRIVDDRPVRKPLSLAFYDASTAHVWRH